MNNLFGELGELIEEDGAELGRTFWKLRIHIAKTDLWAILDPLNTNLVSLAKGIPNLRVSIKTNQTNKHCLVLQNWWWDVKMDCIVINKLMSKLSGYQLPCKDADWLPYIEAA